MEQKSVTVEAKSKYGARRKGNLVEHEGRYRTFKVLNSGRWELTFREDDPPVLPVPAVVYTSPAREVRVVRTVDEETGEDELVIERRGRTDTMGAPVWVMFDDAPADVLRALLALVVQQDAQCCRQRNCEQYALPAAGAVEVAPATGSFCRVHELELQAELAGQGEKTKRRDVVVVTEDELVRHAETPQRCARCGSVGHQLQACGEPLPPPEGA